MTRTVHILVSGRVQGVFFRKFTKQKADELTVNGTVCNLDDGRVKIIAQAENDKLEPFIAWCHKGPITARVEQVEVNDLPDDTEYQVFEIM